MKLIKNNKFNLILAVLIIFCLQSWTKADDISDFQIEGMSIGDSALDYFTKKEIRTEKKYRIKYPGSNKFYAITFGEYPKFKVYDSIQINVKKKDKKYTIYSISGINYYSDNIDKCLQQMELISDDIIKIFPDSSTTKRTKKHEYDKSGKSLIHQYIFDMDSGDEVRAECYDWSKNVSWNDHLRVRIVTNKFDKFLRKQ